MNKMTPSILIKKLKKIKATGIETMGGHCGVLALGLKSILPESELLGVCNAYLLSQGLFAGHFVVLWQNRIWDLDFCIKGPPWDSETKTDIESWGMLDPEDPDYSFDSEDQAYEIQWLKGKKAEVWALQLSRSNGLSVPLAEKLFQEA